ncbi:hypothetical protein FGIG_02025, partial [Fasciola gigantica]
WIYFNFVLWVLLTGVVSQKYEDEFKKEDIEGDTLPLELEKEEEKQSTSEKTHPLESDPLERWFALKQPISFDPIPPEQPLGQSEGDVSLKLEPSDTLQSYRCYVCTYCDSVDEKSTTIEGGCTECVVTSNRPGLTDRKCSRQFTSLCRDDHHARCCQEDLCNRSPKLLCSFQIVLLPYLITSFMEMNIL